MSGSRLFLRSSLSILIVVGVLLSTGGGALATPSAPAVPDASLSEPLALSNPRGAAEHVEQELSAETHVVATELVSAQSTGTTNTLRVYGESDLDAAFPYASKNYTGTFALTNAEAPPKDFVQFNPAIMRHDDDDSLGRFGEYFGNAIQAGGDASEKVHLRMWYVPAYAAPQGLTYPQVTDKVVNPQGDILLEYTYILLDPDTLDPQTGPPQATRLVFPLAGVGEPPGLDRMDVNRDDRPEALGIDRIVGVVTGTLGTHQVVTYTTGIADNLKTTNGVIQVSAKEALEPISVPEGGQVQFLDYMVKLEGVSLSGDRADVSLWYVGNAAPALLDVVTLGLDEAALVGRFWSPKVEELASGTAAEAAAEAAMVATGSPARPFWVTLDSITWDGDQWYARLTPHRLLMTGETLFVDCVEYDVAAILVEDAILDVGEIAPEIKYITLRNPLPKGEGELHIPGLTVDKCQIPAGESLWLLPPFNYQHDMVDDVNIPELPNTFGPDDQEVDNTVVSHIAASYGLIEERIVEDVQPLDGDLSIYWVIEVKEERFDTNLMEEKFIQTQADTAWGADWQWINIETRPWNYTEFSLPELPDQPTELGYTSGDYILVSSFLTEDSITTTHEAGAVRLKFAYDADGNPLDIYVNSVCQNTLRVYGRDDRDAAFPYASENYTGPLALTNGEAPPKDFVQFNPAIMLHDDDDSLGQFEGYFGNAIQAGGDASEEVHLRLWYVPAYAAPQGLTYPQVPAVVNDDGDIVLEYTYILLDPNTLDPQTGPPQGTLMVFPMAGREGQRGLDRMDVNGDNKPETLSIDEIVGVVTGTLGAHQVITHTDGITDNLKTTRGVIEVSPQEVQVPIRVPVGGQVQFLDYMAELEGVSLFGEWADVSLWYIGNAAPSLLGTVRLELDTAALAGRFWGPAVEKFSDAAQAEAAAEAAMVATGLPARPFWVTLDSIVESSGTVYARLTPHRLLMTGETLFVDCVEYDVAAVLVEDADLRDGEIGPEIQYLTLRNPLPKGEGVWDIPGLTVDRCRIPASGSLWMLPPFNYEHDMVDDVNIPESASGPDHQEVDSTVAGRVVTDTPALDGDPFIGWVAEDKEKHFDTNLLEEKFVQTVVGDVWDQDWQWINIETTPWDYTELILPELPDQSATGDYILVSSFLTEDSTSTAYGCGAVRLKFAYDAVNGTGIYVDPRPGSQEGFFQGRVKLESADYQALALHVQVIAEGSVTVDTTVPTDASGYFTLTLEPGTYSVWVKEAHALAKRMDDIVITAGAITACDFGEFLVGDADDDNLVDIRDYGVWKSKLRSTTDLRADFNLDRQVTSLDFGWIKQNFGKPGYDPLTGQASTSCGGAGTSSLPGLSPADTVTVYLDPATSSVSSAEVFTMAIKVAAGAEEVDSADVYIDFVPTFLEVTGVTGSGVLDESGRAWDNGLGELFYGVADLNKTASGTFSLATITFRARSASVAGTPVTFSSAPPRKTTVNSGVTPLPLVTQPATVAIRDLGVSIEPPVSTVHVGAVFTLTVQIEAGAQELDGAQAFVDFDPTYITVTNISGGVALPTELYTFYDNALGRADYAAGAAISMTVSGTLALASIAFRAVTVTVGTPTQLSFQTSSPRETLVILGETTLSSILEGGMIHIVDSKEYYVYLPLILRNYPPVYTVSGQVIDEAAVPVPDVTISSQAGYTAATDGDGHYTLSGLLAGTYTIVPFKQDYTFAPASHTVSVPPEAIGRDFIATPNPTPTPSPTNTPPPTTTPTPTGTPVAGATPTHIPSPTPRPCMEGIANGGFEYDGYWELPLNAYPAAYTSAAAHSGYRSMRVGIINPVDNRYSYSSARQLVTIPANATSATLRFWLYPVTGEPPDNLSLPARLLALAVEDVTLYGDAQYVDILDQNDQWIARLLWQRRNYQVWTFHQFDLLAYAGRTVKLYFGAYNDGTEGVTGMYVDDVSLEVCTSP